MNKNNFDNFTISNYRYERKYFIENTSFAKVKSIIKIHPYQFSEIYEKRFINNIYFDTPTYQCLNDNILGINNRKKARIRWYGDPFGKIKNPKLELKIKNGLLGKKHTILIKPFEINIGDQINYIDDSIINKNLNHNFDLNGFRPTLLNSYLRRYFLSRDKRFRITIDCNQFFYILRNNRVPINKVKDSTSIIVELKYESKHDDLSRDVSTHFPFRLSKSSKYVRGLLLFN